MRRRSEGGLLASGVTEGAAAPRGVLHLPAAKLRGSGDYVEGAFTPATVAGPRRTWTGFPVPQSRDPSTRIAADLSSDRRICERRPASGGAAPRPRRGFS